MQNKKGKHYNFAGVQVMIETSEFEELYSLEQFAAEITTPDIEYSVILENVIDTPEAELIYKKHGYEVYKKSDERIRLLRHDTTQEIVMLDIEGPLKKHRVQFLKKYPEAWGLSMVMKILDLPRQMIQFNGIFLHASFVVWKGEAILFSGQKQIGKSTQAGLWEQYKNAVTANGDRAILKRIDGKWFACGSPYSGTSGICENMKCPIRCIVILSQGEKNQICKANAREALRSLMANCSYDVWEKEQLIKAMEIMEEIINEVEFVKFSCLPDKSAVDVLEAYLCQTKI